MEQPLQALPNQNFFARNARAIWLGIVYLFVTGPGAVSDWTSLIKSYFGGDAQLNINFGSYYGAIFPIAGLAILLFGIWWLRPKQVIKYFGQIKDGAVIGKGFEFFPSRGILTRHHPLPERIRSASVIWGLWHTGTKAWSDDVLKIGHVKRLVLPHPTDSPINHIAFLVGKKTLDIAREITKLTTEAIEVRKEQDRQNIIDIKDRIEVLWYKGVTTNAVMIGNPEPLSNNSWVQVETLLPMPLDDRPSFSLAGKETEFKKLSENIISGYIEIWSKSTIPVNITDEVLVARWGV
jgi:hypothetical protein